MPEKPAWDERYRDGDTPWDHGFPSRELQHVLWEWRIPPAPALELGCGTGENAIFLAQRGFQVTALDVSPRAIDRAREKAERAGVQVTFLAADFAELPDTDGAFRFVFDRGFYHCVRGQRLEALTDLMNRNTRSGTRWLSLVGNANDPAPQDHGPPRVSAREICQDWEALFDIVQMREFNFAASAVSDLRPLAWSVLMRRR
jgi:SAM-dependent methyltransferase